MIGTIVIPLDGSALAEQALVYGSGIAERSGAPLLLLRIASVGADDSEMAECRDYLRKVGHDLPGRIQMEVLRGHAAEKIVEASNEVVDPIIVMSTHGRGGLQRWMTGSVADKVVRTADCPVLLVRSGMELPSQLELHSILVPVDGSEYSEFAVEYAAGLAQAFGSRIHLVRVVDTPSAYAMLSRHMETAVTGDILDEIIESMTREATEYVEQTAARLSERGLRIKTQILEGYPGEQLIEYERRGFFQLVVMATSGRSGVSRIVFGSVAERVLKMGRSPVMMIRPRIQPSAEAAENDE
jgi:nucleotide-binding universal stress UspA family protein